MDDATLSTASSTKSRTFLILWPPYSSDLKSVGFCAWILAWLAELLAALTPQAEDQHYTSINIFLAVRFRSRPALPFFSCSFFLLDSSSSNPPLLLSSFLFTFIFVQLGLWIRAQCRLHNIYAYPGPKCLSTSIVTIFIPNTGIGSTISQSSPYQQQKP